MKFYLRTIPELLMTSRISYETPNNLRSHHQKYPITTLASTNVKCVTLWVREHVDMIETPLRSIIISGTWMPMMAPTHSTKIFIEVEPLCRGLKQSIFHFLCLAIFYLPEIRSSVLPYLVQSRSW